MKGWTRTIVLGAFVGVLLGGGYVIAQDVNTWVGHMVFRQASPQIRFNGSLTFRKASDNTVLATISQSGQAIGASGTNVGQLRFYGTNVTPSAIAATGALDAGGLAEVQTAINITGIATTDTIFVNGPTPTVHCPLTGAFASATDVVSLVFSKMTGDACTPAAGFHRIWAVRT